MLDHNQLCSFFAKFHLHQLSPQKKQKNKSRKGPHTDARKYQPTHTCQFFHQRTHQRTNTFDVRLHLRVVQGAPVLLNTEAHITVKTVKTYYYSSRLFILISREIINGQPLWYCGFCEELSRSSLDLWVFYLTLYGGRWRFQGNENEHFLLQYSFRKSGFFSLSSIHGVTGNRQMFRVWSWEPTIPWKIMILYWVLHWDNSLLMIDQYRHAVRVRHSIKPSPWTGHTEYCGKVPITSFIWNIRRRFR